MLIILTVSVIFFHKKYWRPLDKFPRNLKYYMKYLVENVLYLRSHEDWLLQLQNDIYHYMNNYHSQDLIQFYFGID